MLYTVAVELLMLLSACSLQVTAHDNDVYGDNGEPMAAGGPIVATKYGELEGSRRVYGSKNIVRSVSTFAATSLYF